MIDIKIVRGDMDRLRTALSNRHADIDLQPLADADARRRELIQCGEQRKAEQNEINKRVPAMKKNGEDTSELFARLKALGNEAKAFDEQIRAIDDELNHMLLHIPNLPDESVPVGADEADNVEVRRWGQPRAFDFEPLPHWELGEQNGLLRPDVAAKVTGSRFHVTFDKIAKLERALMNLFLDTHTSHGYTEVHVPYMVHRRSMTGTGQLPKFEEDAFRVHDTEYFLVPTAEVPVTNIHREEILLPEQLPIRYCAYTPCFRREAGSASRDTRGLIRQHQFGKVELVKFATPENSFAELESLTGDAERILQLLGLPYRVVALCTGDMGFASAKTYDIEVWMPSYNRYVEISSCSNFTDFQARRAGIRFRRTPQGKPEFVHTLNGSGIPTGRSVAAIMENFQQADGSIVVPEALRKYTGFVTIHNG